MPKKIFRKKYVPKAKKAPKRKAMRRRLGLGAPSAAVTGAGIANIGVGAYQMYNAYQNWGKVPRKIARRNVASRIQQSDNITTVAPVVIGTQRQPTFQEKVAMTIRPPLSFKRNYQFNAESLSGRKGWFCMNVNTMDIQDLQLDMTNYKSAMTTDTGVGDSQIAPNTLADDAQFYIDYHKESIKMVNSSSNALTGKIHLFVHKRDTDGTYDSCGINPINLMMYYSANSKSLLISGVGNEAILGNGFQFTTAVGVTNYSGSYNMPGSSINAAGLTASTDPILSPTSSFLKDRVGFWFNKISTSSFSLKPGQQFNSSFVFNLENHKLRRELQEFIHIAGVSHSIVVEFQGGIVGDSTVTTGDGVVSTGSAQLSVIRENTRVLGLSNKLRPKIVLQTNPLTTIAPAAQVIINPDSGVQLAGAQTDV